MLYISGGGMYKENDIAEVLAGVPIGESSGGQYRCSSGRSERNPAAKKDKKIKSKCIVLKHMSS